MCYNQIGDISTLNGSSLKLVDKFTYLGNSASSTETDTDTWLTKPWATIDTLSVVWKSDLTDKIKRSFSQAAVVSILLYGCTTWTLTKQMEKTLDGNYTRMLREVLNKFCWQHPTKQPLYAHLPHITKTIKIRQTRHAGHCWRSRDEHTSEILLWTPSNGRAKAGQLARTYILQLCEDTGCSPEDLLEEMNDRQRWRERVMMMMIRIYIYWNVLYLYIYISPSCHAARKDFTDSLSPPVSIVHRSRQVFQATSCIGTELWYIRFLLVVQPLLVHVKGSTGLRRLWVCPYFSSSVLHVWSI